MKYKIVIKDGTLSTVEFGGIIVETVSVSIIGHKEKYASLILKNGEKIFLCKDQVEFKHF
jgi:hypothetical protein